MLQLFGSNQSLNPLMIKQVNFLNQFGGSQLQVDLSGSNYLENLKVEGGDLQIGPGPVLSRIGKVSLNEDLDIFNSSIIVDTLLLTTQVQRFQ
ncbi:MAG: hypothetical protein IPJ79_12025 [Bacteroidetes bacterium]|nr:hypothetical protein [Bacteroidota bacterium]